VGSKKEDNNAERTSLAKTLVAPARRLLRHSRNEPGFPLLQCNAPPL